MPRFKLPAILLAGFAVLFYIFFQYCKQAPGLGAINPFNKDPYDAVGSFAVQLAFVAAGLALLRAFRPYSKPGPPPGQILLFLRCGSVALLAAAITLAADFIGLGRATLAEGFYPALRTLALLVGGMAVLTGLAGWLLWRSGRGVYLPTAAHPWLRAVLFGLAGGFALAVYPLGWREASLLGALFAIIAGMLFLFILVWAFTTAIFPDVEFAYADFFDDLAAVYTGVKGRLKWFQPALIWVEKMAAWPAVRRLAGWLNSRRHRWSLVVLLGISAGALLAAAEAAGEGPSSSSGVAALVFGVFVSMEVLAVVGGYLFLGKYLGIYRSE
jgi:hypothetical protein